MIEDLLAHSSLPDEVKDEARAASTVDSNEAWGLVLALTAVEPGGDSFWGLRGELIDLAVMA